MLYKFPGGLKEYDTIVKSRMDIGVHGMHRQMASGADVLARLFFIAMKV